ncbi:hypothetical protein RJ639_016970 [Escallonia herrerae]|uniref:Transposase (putative) gypsy type domain-containing protein n=1 Tax=Escallonia herrerae TaxID=1293975 RepID=A0AA88VF15_9ASTE|nr:hypothetical protein RJ639_016970 [Escallonia herrerae]
MGGYIGKNEEEAVAVGLELGLHLEEDLGEVFIDGCEVGLALVDGGGYVSFVAERMRFKTKVLATIEDWKFYGERCEYYQMQVFLNKEQTIISHQLLVCLRKKQSLISTFLNAKSVRSKLFIASFFKASHFIKQAISQPIHSWNNFKACNTRANNSNDSKVSNTNSSIYSNSKHAADPKKASPNQATCNECSDEILFGRCHFARAECSDRILFGQNSAQPRSLCSGKVFGHDSARAKPYSAVCHSARAECSGRILLGQSVRKNALGDVKDQADDKANPKPWYTADKKSGKMSTEDLQNLIREYPLPEGWYARLPGLQEPANYGTKFETGVYEEQVKSGYRLPLHPFALRFFEHYCMAPGQLVPNGWRKLAGLIYLVQTLGYKPDATDFMRVFFEICFVKGVANYPGWYYIYNRQRLLKGGPKSNKGWHSRYFFVGRLDKGELRILKILASLLPTTRLSILSYIKLRDGLCINEPFSEEQFEWAKIIPPRPIPAGRLIPSSPRAIPSVTSAETIPLGKWLAELENRHKEAFSVFFRKLRGSKEKHPSAELPPVPKRTRVTPPERSPRILEQMSIDDDPIFRPRWTLRRDDLGMPDSQMYVNGSEMLSRFEMARQVAAKEAQQKREAVKKAQEASHRAEELSKQEANHLAQIVTLEKRLEGVKRKAAEEVTKARDQGICDFLDGNAGDEWLKKRTDDGLEIYELGFAKAKEMFAERFPDIPLGDFVLPAIVSPSGETVMPSEVGDAAASHLPGEECSAITLFGQNVLAKLITLFRQSVRLSLYSDGMFGHHSARAECSAITLLGQSVRPSLCLDIIHVLPNLRCRRRDHIEAYENWEAVLLSGWPLITDIQSHPLGEIILENDI